MQAPSDSEIPAVPQSATAIHRFISQPFLVIVRALIAWGLIAPVLRCPTCQKTLQCWRQREAESENRASCTWPCSSTRYHYDYGSIFDKRLSQVSLYAKILLLFEFAVGTTPKEAWVNVSDETIDGARFKFTQKQAQHFWRVIRSFLVMRDICDGPRKLGGLVLDQTDDELQKTDGDIVLLNARQQFFRRSACWRDAPNPEAAPAAVVQFDEADLQNMGREKRKRAQETQTTVRQQTGSEKWLAAGLDHTNKKLAFKILPRGRESRTKAMLSGFVQDTCMPNTHAVTDGLAAYDEKKLR